MKVDPDPWGSVKSAVSDAIADALRGIGWSSPRDVIETLEDPPDPGLGDIASTVCFEMAKDLKMPPAEIAKRLAERIATGGLILRVEPVNGYLNFFLDLHALGEITLTAVEKMREAYGRARTEKKGKVIIEHTSVNPTKPLHIGHGRNAVIGDTVARIMKALGHTVEVHNYIDDMGRQMAETVLAFRRIKRKPRAKFDHVLGLLYSQMHQMLGSDPKLEGEVDGILRGLESGIGRWCIEARRIAEKCVRANLETAERLGVVYDLLVWESDLVRSGAVEEVIESLRRSGRLVEGTGENSGALVLRLGDVGLEDKVLVRSDGTTVYTARDIAYQMWKFGKTRASPRMRIHSVRGDGRRTFTTSPRGKASERFGGAKMVINVVGAEQRFPQQVVSAALRILGYEEESRNSLHLAYEHVWLPSGKFSGRKGTWVGFSVDDALEEAVARARAAVEEHSPEAPEGFKRKIAELVGVGAVRYSLLSTSPEKRITFRWEEALNFERNSGPAIQYSYARACSIIRKAGRSGMSKMVKLDLPEERTLIKLLARFPQVIDEAGRTLGPHLLAIYASDLAFAFNRFYEAAPVLTAETRELRETRLRLVSCTRMVLRNVMDLLGIPAPERM
ncbi:MAG: arginine--tRNA ligase [Candidatus Hadarchaeales archaeon]